MVVDKKGKPIENAEVTVSSPNLDTVFKLLTTNKGICEFLIPIGHGYSIDLGQIKNADYIEIPDEAYYELESKYYIDREFALSLPELNVNLNVATSEGEPVSERFEIVSLDDKSSYTIRTDPSGNAKTELPAGQTYQVNFNDAENYMRFSIPDDPQYFMNVDIEYGGSGKGRLYPTLDKMLVVFHYFDFDSIGVPNEVITISGLDKEFEYQVQTNQDGWAWAQLPQGNKYVFSTSILDEFQRVSAGYSHRTRGLEPGKRYEVIAEKAQKDKEGIDSINRGLKDFEEGRTHSHDEVRKKYGL